MTQETWFLLDHNDGYDYVTVAEMIAALQKMPQSAKVLITISDYEMTRRLSDVETGIPRRVHLTKHEDYYQEDDKIVEIRS